MNEEYEIKAYTKFSWGYVYTQNGRRNEIWADSAESLKRKVSAKNLAWDDRKVPKAKPIKVTLTHESEMIGEGSPASFRLPWCESNYKRY